MPILDDILDRARAHPRRIALAESNDERVLRGAARLARERIVEPVLLGKPDEVRARARAAGVDPSILVIEDPIDGPGRHGCRAAASEALAGKGLDDATVDELMRDPLYCAAAMVRAGQVAGTLAGAAHSTAQTLRAALRIIGPAADARTVSSFFLMALREPTDAGDEVLAFADCGLVPYPDEEELADIAARTAGHYRLLVGGEPRVAFLSFSTLGSAEHESVDRVRRAREILLEAAPDFPLDGELQADAALVPAVGRAKAPGSVVAGRANVLIFPNLDAGNIAYKLVERLAGARAIGPILQGLERPANDLSRGCSEEDIVVAAAVTSLQAGSP
jgi:phosphate acetyltransferase